MMVDNKMAAAAAVQHAAALFILQIASCDVTSSATDPHLLQYNKY
jgi:hypothetical protein